MLSIHIKPYKFSFGRQDRVVIDPCEIKRWENPYRSVFIYHNTFLKAIMINPPLT